MSTSRSTGVLLVVFAALNLVAVALLATTFGWPAVLGEPAAVVLPAFAGAQTSVVTGFMLFTLLSVALIPISIGLHREIADRRPSGLWLPTVTAVGIVSGLAQTLGWIRWPLVVPGLATAYLDPATSPELRTATEASYELINSYAGAALGEYLGWLFQALWALGIAVLLLRAGVVGVATSLVGVVLTGVWALSFLVGPFVLALAEGVVATAAFAAYGVWFLWLGAVGLRLLRTTSSSTRPAARVAVGGAA
ncbi:MAG: DUF4386 family protein [Pseudonocardia sp.]|nr:DUF4386 family protein [Pseudonocardia sp.]